MSKLIIITTLLATLVVSSTAFYLFPGVEDFPAQMTLAITLAVVVPQAVAIWAFLTSLGVFRKELRFAYYILAVGILSLSLSQLQLPADSFIAIDPIASSWFITGSTLMGALLIYVSMHKFIRLLNVKSPPWSSFIVVLIFSLLLAFVSTFIPHVPYPFEEWLVDGIFGTYVTAGGFAISAAMLATKIRRKLAPSYRPAMSWLVAGATVLAFAAFHETLLRLLPSLNEESFAWYSEYGVSLWPLLLVAVLFLGASLSFKKIAQEFAELPQGANHLEIINYVAGLVSNPAAIDVKLDKVRELTATGATASSLSAAQKATLLQVYEELEAYLVTKEPLVKLTREDLRARLPDTFRQELDAEKTLN